MRWYILPLLVLTINAHSAQAQQNKNSADDEAVVTSISLNDLKDIVREKEHKIINSSKGEEDPFIFAEADNGTRYYLSGQACEKQRCAGLNIRVNYKLDDEPDYEKINETNLQRAAANVFYQEQRLSISRYIILDYGMTLKNIKLNIDVLLTTANSSYKYYTSP